VCKFKNIREKFPGIPLWVIFFALIPYEDAHDNRYEYKKYESCLMHRLRSKTDCLIHFISTEYYGNLSEIRCYANSIGWQYSHSYRYLANEAGVGIQTYKRFIMSLNNKPSVNNETKEEILHAADKLNYNVGTPGYIDKLITKDSPHALIKRITKNMYDKLVEDRCISHSIILKDILAKNSDEEVKNLINDVLLSYKNTIGTPISYKDLDAP
jgi:hypothetical protein